jgi:hypothetical protein
MTDQLTRTAQQVRNGNHQASSVHRVVADSTTDDGRLYDAACGRQLTAAQGAILTTRFVTCDECVEAQKPTRAEMPAVAHA